MTDMLISQYGKLDFQIKQQGEHNLYNLTVFCIARCKEKGLKLLDKIVSHMEDNDVTEPGNDVHEYFRLGNCIGRCEGQNLDLLKRLKAINEKHGVQRKQEAY